MNLTAPEAAALAAEVRRDYERDGNLGNDRDVMVAPPAIDIPAVARELYGSGIKLGAQNMHYEDRGAFTGEISPPMLKAAGVVYVIIGQSERRHIFGEHDDWIYRKVRAALHHGLTPILCVGETEAQHDSGQALSVVLKQIENGLVGVAAAHISRVVIAYEPVWAIGTGRNATPEQAELVHGSIRETLAARFGHSAADETRIIYGGSVTPANVDSLIAQPDIDGALVGGASLKADSFARIIRAGR
jgi:triosephosphate isomerase